MRIDLKKEPEPTGNPMLDMLQREFQKRRPRSMGEAQRIADDFQSRYNRTVQADLGGMSPDQVYTLTQPGYMERSLILNDHLTSEELIGAPLFQNARRLLLAVREMGVAKATATGAFNRKLATQMFNEFEMSDQERSFLRKYNKVFNQNDVPELYMLRVLLPAAGLLLFRKGEFKVTKYGATLLTEATVGGLYALLFRTLYNKVNFAALDRLPEASFIQQTSGFGISQVAKWEHGWMNLIECVSLLFLPTVLEILPELSYVSDSSPIYADHRILRPLKLFGLIEFESETTTACNSKIRKTELFDKFIQLNLPPAFN